MKEQTGILDQVLDYFNVSVTYIQNNIIIFDDPTAQWLVGSALAFFGVFATLMTYFRMPTRKQALQAPGVSPETFLMMKEVGIVDQAIRRFLRDMGEAGVEPEKMDEVLAEIAQRHTEMLQRLEELDASDDPKVEALLQKARKAIALGDYEAAEPKLAQAEEIDLTAITKAEEEANRRRLRAAETRAERASLLAQRFDYAGAAEHYEKAAEIAHSANELAAANYLRKSGSANFSAANFDRAEQQLNRAMKLWVNNSAAPHPQMALIANMLGGILSAKGDYSAAKAQYERAIALWETTLGSEHPDLPIALCNLAAIHQEEGQLDKAEELVKKALSFWQSCTTDQTSYIAMANNLLAGIYQNTSRVAEAERLYRESLSTLEAEEAPEWKQIADCQRNLAVLLDSTGRPDEARKLFQSALGTLEKVFGPNHPDIAYVLNNLAASFCDTGEYQSAQPLLVRAIKIMEQHLPDHPVIEVFRDNLVGVNRMIEDNC